MNKITFLVALFMFFWYSLFAQSEKRSSNLNFEGQIMASANANALFMNLGGPTLKLSFPKISVGVTLYPSFKFENTDSKLVVSPVLGVGPQLCFLKDKRFILAIPCYYYASKNFWTATVGFGYILTRPKKQ